MINIDKLPCGYIEISKNRQILQINRYACNMLDAQPGDLKGVQLESILSPASRVFVDSYAYPLLFDRSSAKELQLNLQSRNGQKFSVVVNIAMEDNDSTVWTFMGSENRDKLYEELLTTRDTLTEKAEELKALYHQIHSEHEDLQLFCHSLSHDFVAPIRRAKQFISMAAEDMRDKNLKVDDELVLLNNAERGMDTLMMLIRGLLEYLNADAKEQKNELVDLNEIVLRAFKLNEDQDERPITLTNIDVLPTVVGSPAQLQLIFKNLIGNAIKYTKKPPEIQVSCSRDAETGHYTVAVKDNGIGMSAEHHAKIFEPFCRLHAEREYDGSGLGLSIVKKLVSKHGGDISVNSELDKGSTFYLTFPFC